MRPEAKDITEEKTAANDTNHADAVHLMFLPSQAISNINQTAAGFCLSHTYNKMTSNKLTTLALLLLSCQLTQAFLPSWLPGVVPTSPDLNRYTAEVTSSTFDCRFNIGLPGHGAVFPINDLQFRLCKGAGTNEERVALPGTDGPRPHLSSGPHRISTVTEGSYISMDGVQSVPLIRGAWELIWRADSHCGFLICGFNLEKDVRRNENGAVLPKGE